MSTTWAMFVVLDPASVFPASVPPASLRVPASPVPPSGPGGGLPASSWLPPASGLEAELDAVPQAVAVKHAASAQALTDHEYDVAGTVS
jgi:hypothetical protein